MTFTSGIALFVIQIRVVWANFVMKRTAFGTSKTTMEKIPLPPIILCPEILDLDMSMADTNLFLDQFYKLNDDIRVHFNRKMDLQLGQNFDQEGNLMQMSTAYQVVFGDKNLNTDPEEGFRFYK